MRKDHEQIIQNEQRKQKITSHRAICAEYGSKAEYYVADILLSQGYEILDKNFTVRKVGEIDIIARREDELFFVEVKARSNEKDFNAENACVTQKKIQKIRKCADFYLQKNDYSNAYCRIIGAFVHIGSNGSMGDIRIIPLD
jgi:putative endonuclease